MLISVVSTKHRNGSGRHARRCDRKLISHTVSIQWSIDLEFEKIDSQLTNVRIHDVHREVTKVLLRIGQRKARVLEVHHLVRG